MQKRVQDGVRVEQCHIEEIRRWGDEHHAHTKEWLKDSKKQNSVTEISNIAGLLIWTQNQMNKKNDRKRKYLR